MNREIAGDLLVIVGPTAVGKTALSLELAEAFDGEIISGDSMQVYRGMDIGTAKAGKEERARIPHHLIDIKDPEEPFSVAEFQRLALDAIEGIQQRGRLPILVGGTGLYVQSVVYYPHYQFTDVSGNREFRAKWERFAEEHGDEALWAEVNRVDPETAKRLHPNDRRRLIRALEIYESTGRPMSQVQPQEERKTSPFRHLILGLTLPREILYERINRRVDQMIAAGLIDEVRRLVEAGIDPNVTSMQSLGYKEVIPFLEGKASLEETAELIKKRTRQFAKRQLTWFRKMPHIHWIDASGLTDPKKVEEIKRLVAGKFGWIRE